MPRLFISYRRTDSPESTGRIYDRLAQVFGPQNVFRDIDSIPLGVPFPDHLRQTLSQTDVVLVIIGPEWLSVTDDDGNPRIHDDDDFVRMEVETALQLDLPVIPVLVANASLPAMEDLPEQIQQLAKRNGIAVRPDPDFHHDIDRLCARLEEIVGSPTRDESTGPLRKKTGLLRTLGNVFVLLWLAFVVLGQTWIWGLWEPVHGRSIQNLITVSMVMATCLVLLFWILCLSRMKWIKAIPLALLILVPAGTLLGSIRQVDFTGDMFPVLRFRWEPTDLERLELAPQLPVPESTPTGDEFPSVQSEDFAEFRGANRDGVVIGPRLREDWSDAAALEIWRRPCGGGYSSFAVVDDYAVTIEQRGDEETVVCYSLETGGERWTYAYSADFQEAMGGPGPRSTPTIHDGLVFSIGAFGDLYCLNLLDGSAVWYVDVLTDNDLLWPPDPENSQADRRQVPTWAMASSPLIVDRLLVVNAGGPDGGGLVAYDFESGERVWQTDALRNPVVGKDAENRAGYSSPMLVELDGVRQIINLDGVGLWGFVPETGVLRWHFRFDKSGGDPGCVNVAQPLLFPDNRLFISASYGRGAVMLRVEHEGWEVARLWPPADDVNLNLRSKFSSPVLHEGYIYGLDEGVMVCLDPDTGERMWKRGRYGHGQLLLTNDQILVLSEDGELALVAPDPAEWREITRLPALPGGKTWNPPVLVRGRALVRNHMEMACFDLAAE